MNNTEGSTRSAKPIFESVFGSAWNDLPPILVKHYSIRPYTTDNLKVKGHLDVESKGIFKYLGWLFRTMGNVPAVTERLVPVTVTFQSNGSSANFHFCRHFDFKHHRPYYFHSKMRHLNGPEVVELMKFGLGWRSIFDWDGHKITMTHNGYVLSIFGKLLPLPLAFLLGKGSAEEIAINDKSFAMSMKITHPIWGERYSYSGQFEVVP